MPREAVFVVPGRLDARTGGSIYDRRIIEGLRRLGWRVAVLEAGDTFPSPSIQVRAAVSVSFERIPEQSVVVVDGLVLGGIPEIVERESHRLHLVALVHLPLGADVTRDRDTARRLEESEQRALRCAAAVVVTGRATSTLLSDLKLNRVDVVEPGADRAPVARGSSSNDVELLTVAAVHHGKGHHLVLAALASLPYRNWHLTCAGSLTRDPQTVERLRAIIRDGHLETHVSFTGELDTSRLDECYERADVFVLATLQETYGMAVAEALAHGLPVIGTTTGALPDLVGRDAGILVSPGDQQALASTLDRVLGPEGPELRRRLAFGARQVRERLRTWDDAAHDMDKVLSGIVANG